MLEQLRQKMTEAGADALLVTTPANVRYLSGFTSPADARILLTEDTATLITDGRYIAQVNEESRLPVDIVASSAGWLERVVELAKPHTLAVEADHLTVKQFQELKDKLEREPVPTTGLVTDFRLVKTPEELGFIRKAARIADDAFAHILTFIRAGLSEVEVALELEAFMRRAGAERKAFDITVASGRRSSMPHGTASPKIIQDGELATLDFGAVVDGYNSDMTRTVAVGEVSERDRRLYDAVLDAQEAALAELGPDKDGKALDALTREVLKKYDLEAHFTHGLGHGVGLEVHEAPSLTFRKSDILKPGMVVTVEPGVYLPGEAGVRIEDLCVITETGYERLSNSSKEFTEL
ncbi:Xaa-Pro peptidase family protein [soil metagenome]